MVQQRLKGRSVSPIQGVLIIAGIILHNRGKKTEGEQLKKLEAIRRDKLDALLHEIHGAVPGKTIEPQE